MMSDKTARLLIEYLKAKGWSDEDIGKLFEYISQ